MNIGICCYPTHGGSGVVATELGIELGRQGHVVHFISYRRPFRLNRLYPGVYFHQVDVSQYPLFEYPPYSLALASKIVEIARREGLDLVHAHYAIPHTVSAWMSREMLGGDRLPVVSTLHGTDITLVGQEPGYLEVTRFALRQTDALTAVSRFLCNETRHVFGTELDLRCIHNFVDPEEFKPGCNRELRARFASCEEPLLLHISNFRPVKRVPEVVEIFRRVNERTPARLLLAGNGPEKAGVRELVRSHGLCERVVFLGNQESIVDLMSIADLFVLPSETESFGLAALEAMSSGVPVLASRVGGLPELVDSGHNSWLCSPGEPGEFSERALELLSDEEAYGRMSRRARETAVDRFSIERVIPQYMEVYEALVS